MIVLCKLVASAEDLGGYIIYVFECLEDFEIKKSKYIMCVKFPNWETKSIALGDIGYLYYEERKAGIDTWWDGQNYVPYRYNTIQFIKFIEKIDKKDEKYIL